jgi:hypothetical protein
MLRLFNVWVNFFPIALFFFVLTINYLLCRSISLLSHCFFQKNIHLGFRVPNTKIQKPEKYFSASQVDRTKEGDH